MDNDTEPKHDTSEHLQIDRKQKVVLSLYVAEKWCNNRLC